MRRILRINGTPILNLYDLQKHFSPWEVYNNIADFAAFAAVHCVPLPVRYIKDGITETAVIIDKQFWLDALTGVNNYQEKTALALLRELKSDAIKALKKDNPDENRDEDVNREYLAQQLEKKLEHIVKASKLKDTADDAQKAVKMLAICELSEIDPLVRSDFRIMDERALQPGRQKPDAAQGEAVLPFPMEKTLILTAMPTPYRYYLYEGKELKQGEIIHTVCVCAKASNRNQYEKVKIQLYSSDGKTVKETIELNPEEFRYCTAAGGKLIRFQPTESSGRNLRLIRANLKTPDITVSGASGEDWHLSLDGISCFSAVDADTGFMFVERGKPNGLYYTPYHNDFMTQTKISMILRPVVEVYASKNGYRLLCENGEIITNETGVNTAQRVPTLFMR